MKKIVFLVSFIFLTTCSNSHEDDIEEHNFNITIELLTNEPNYDEVILTYYNYETRKFTSDSYNFTYNAAGEPLPFTLELKNYAYKFIRGEAYRNNNSSAFLKLNLYVDGELVLEDSNKGTTTSFATVKFNYTIAN